MKKILTVAKNEYLIAITSKAFIVGLSMMPIMTGVAILVQYFTKDQVDLTPRKLAVVDRTERLYDAISQAAEAHNTFGIYAGEGDNRRQTAAEFIVERAVETHATSGDDARIDVQLTEKIQKGELFAFAIIDADLIDPAKPASIHYHTNTPSYGALPNWLSATINATVTQLRAEQLNLSSDVVRGIIQPVPFKRFGLVERSDTGEVKDAEEENQSIIYGVSAAGVFLMFMLVMAVTPVMLNNVLEEKMLKISEFLVSSITPFQLMLGKLLGAIAVGMTLAVIYLGAVYAMSRYFEFSDKVPWTHYAWFIFYLFNALVIFGSMMSAIGAACSEIRDAQSLMTPVILLIMIPLMCFGPILESPTSIFAKAVSLFPPATPLIMFVRITLPPGPAIWEVVLGAIFCMLFATGCVWAAGKIFRIGVLSQGQAPSILQMLRWIFSKP